jgi:hypothetical protein
MLKRRAGWIIVLCAFFSLLPSQIVHASDSQKSAPLAEWTVLIFLSGNNNLDSFGKFNLKQMEQIGSTPQLNVVVQWASLKNDKTQRLLIHQDITHAEVTSPVVESLSTVDMGDPKSLLDFIRWGVQKYPAKHYAIDVWNHGSGWHASTTPNTNQQKPFYPYDISWDDKTDHSISTPALARVLAEAAQIIGHKVDLYGSDACLMGMAEIADEVADFVDIYAGSEEVEAAAGWPYHKILGALAKHPEMNATALGKVITDEFVKFYTGDGPNQGNATFSAFYLNKMTPLEQAMKSLAQDLVKVPENSRKSILDALGNAQRFTYDDYADLTDVLEQLESLPSPHIRKETLLALRKALSELIIASGSSASLPKAYGASIWLPTRSSTLSLYANRYHELKFDLKTGWSQALAYLLN